MKQTAVQFAITVIIVHALISGLHAAAHVNLDIFLPLTPSLFVLIVILLLPLIAGVLLWQRMDRAGATLLAISMAGAFFFGLYYHFVLEGPDHVGHVRASGWGLVFQISSGLLFVSEGLGSWVGLRLLKSAPSAKPGLTQQL